MIVTPPASHATGRCITARATRSQNGWPSTWWRRMRPFSILSPSSEITAGSSVSVAATASTTTSDAPNAMDRKIDCGTMNIASSAITTVNPLNTTARLAVLLAAPMASCLSRPRARSSR